MERFSSGELFVLHELVRRQANREDQFRRLAAAFTGTLPARGEYRHNRMAVLAEKLFSRHETARDREREQFKHELLQKAKTLIPHGRNRAARWLAGRLRAEKFEREEAFALHWEQHVPREKRQPDGSTDLYEAADWESTVNFVYDCDYAELQKLRKQWRKMEESKDGGATGGRDRDRFDARGDTRPPGIGGRAGEARGPRPRPVWTPRNR